VKDQGPTKVELKDEKVVEKEKEIEKEKAPAPVVKEPGKIYIVDKKDTYMSIAKKFGFSMKDLKSLNGIKTEPMVEGMELKVEKDGDYTEYDSKFYVLEKGDESYSKIAKKLNMKSGDLKKLNKGFDEDMFRPGRKLRIAK
jgi:D-gamma-glutamyl-meso-diaminopimelic acid endopeptidase CwlS